MVLSQLFLSFAEVCPEAAEKLCSRAPRTKPALNTKMLTTNDDLL